MEIRRYWLMLIKWIWLIVVVGVAAAGIAYVVSLRSTPVFQATTTLLVNQGQTSASGAAAYQDVLTSERAWRLAWPSIALPTPACLQATSRFACLRHKRPTVSSWPNRPKRVKCVLDRAPMPAWLA